MNNEFKNAPRSKLMYTYLQEFKRVRYCSEMKNNESLFIIIIYNLGLNGVNELVLNTLCLTHENFHRVETHSTMNMYFKTVILHFPRIHLHQKKTNKKI